MARPIDRLEARGVTDSRSSSDDESTNFFVSPLLVEKLFFKENMSVSSLVTTRLGSSRLRDFLVVLWLLPQRSAAVSSSGNDPGWVGSEARGVRQCDCAISSSLTPTVGRMVMTSSSIGTYSSDGAAADSSAARSFSFSAAEGGS